MYKIYKNYFLSTIIISLSFFIFFITPKLVSADNYNSTQINLETHGHGGGANYYIYAGGLPAWRMDWSLGVDGFGDFGAAGGGVGVSVCLTPNGVMWTGACVHAIVYHEGGTPTCGGSGLNLDGRIGNNRGCGFTGSFETTDPSLKHMNTAVYANDAHIWGTIAVYGKSPEYPGPSCAPADACTSSANSCGQTNSGTIQCDGTCDAVAPSNASCPAPSLNYRCSGAGTCIYVNDGTGDTSDSNCNGSCSSGSTVNGSCAATHYHCSSGGLGATAEYSDQWQWWCNGFNGGSNILCSEGKGETSPQPTASCGNGIINIGEQCEVGITGDCQEPWHPGTHCDLSSCRCVDNPPPPPSPITGECGSANKIYPAGSNSYGSDTYCSSGTPTSTPGFPAPGRSVTWYCVGSNGGGSSGECRATLLVPTYNVTAIHSTGGQVRSTDDRINCGGTCSSQYEEGSTVTLQANPTSSYWRFIQWSGDCSGTSPVCILSVNSPKNVTAIFSLRTFNYQEF